MAKDIRQRKCLVTGGVFPSYELIRFVCAPDGEVIPDVAAKLPGRGCWLQADRNVLEDAIDKKLLQRFGHQASLGKKNKDIEDLDADQPKRDSVHITVSADMPSQVENLLKKRCLDHLSLANRAGLVISGFEKVRAALTSGKANVLVTASDGAENGRSKMCQGLEGLKVIDLFCRDDLSKATGLENAVHIAVLSGGLRESLLREISRYERSRKKVIN